MLIPQRLAEEGSWQTDKTDNPILSLKIENVVTLIKD